MNYLLSSFIIDHMLLSEHYEVISARIMQSETEMDFAERLHDMACHQHLLSNAKFVTCFKQVLPDATVSLLEKTSVKFPLRLITTSTLSNSMS